MPAIKTIAEGFGSAAPPQRGKARVQDDRHNATDNSGPWRVSIHRRLGLLMGEWMSNKAAPKVTLDCGGG